MASDQQPEIDRLRTRIREMLARVPASITGNCGVQKVRAYKKVVTDAQKQVSTNRPTLAGMQAAHNNLQSFQ